MLAFTPERAKHSQQDSTAQGSAGKRKAAEQVVAEPVSTKKPRLGASTCAEECDGVKCRFVCGDDSGSVDPVAALQRPDKPPDELERIKFGRGKCEPRYSNAVDKGVHADYYCERVYDCKFKHLWKDRKQFQKKLAKDRTFHDAPWQADCSLLCFSSASIRSNRYQSGPVGLAA